jgi:hypothetical protein
VLPGYEKVRTEVKNISVGLFNFSYYENYNPFGSFKSGLSPVLLSADKQQLIKLANYISNLRTQIGGPIRGSIDAAREKADSLIKLIKKEYHIK